MKSRSGDKDVVVNTSSDTRTNSNHNLELGMSGLSLIQTHGGSQHHRKVTDSTMSSSPPVDDFSNHNTSRDNNNNSFLITGSGSGYYEGRGGEAASNRSLRMPCSPNVVGSKSPFSVQQEQDNVDFLMKTSSEISSPFANHHLHKIAANNSSVHHSNTSCTSPSLTLTPNSTDGSNFMGQSPFHITSCATEGPSLPFLRNNSNNNAGSQTGSLVEHQHRRGETASSFDLANNNVGGIGEDDEDDNDGLFGLEALQFRVASMVTTSNNNGNVISSANSSPRISRGTFAPHQQQEPPGFMSQQQRRASSDRPPLSQSYGDGSSIHSNSDRFSGSGINNYSSTPAAPDSTVGPVYGAIGQLRQNAMEFDPNRRRASSQDYVTGTANVVSPSSNAIPLAYQQHDNASQKFGTLPTLSSHIHQQKNNFSHLDAPKPRHIRSISQPGPPGSGSGPVEQHHHHQQQQIYPPSYDSRFFESSLYPGNSNSYNRSNVKTFDTGSRSASISHQLASTRYDQQQYKGNAASMPDLAYHQSGGFANNNSNSGNTTHERRESYEFHASRAGSYQSNGSFVEGLMSSGAYAGGTNPSSSSPPAQGLYNSSHSHIRQQSDNVVLMQSQQHSLPIGFGSNNLRSHSHDDDMAHVLLGEHIDFPDNDDQAFSSLLVQGSSGGRGSHPLLRGATHSHSLSLDATSFPQQPKIVYAVKFKRSQRNFVLGPRISRDLKIGTYVKVEADRGEDLGIVVGKPPIDFNRQSTFTGRSSFSAGMGPPPPSGPAVDLKRIMRLATHDEVSLLGLKRDEEEELLKICRAKVRQRGLPMNVVDAEYQFDRHKLTFFFEALGRVDFRELVRDLFSMYKTRIWMQQLDKNTSTSAQAIISPQAANLHMDYGTPIIAPTSEFADSIISYGMSSADNSTGSH